MQDIKPVSQKKDTTIIMDTKDYLEKELSRLLHWIQAADTRLAFILPLTTAMLGALALLAPKPEAWSSLAVVMFSFSVLFLVLSVIFSACASFPRTNGPKGSLLYFSGIESRELNQFSIAAKEMTDTQYIDDLISQCHINAQICEKKFSHIRHALACLFISSIPWSASIFILYGNK